MSLEGGSQQVPRLSIPHNPNPTFSPPRAHTREAVEPGNGRRRGEAVCSGADEHDVSDGWHGDLCESGWIFRAINAAADANILNWR